MNLWEHLQFVALPLLHRNLAKAEFSERSQVAWRKRADAWQHCWRTVTAAAVVVDDQQKLHLLHGLLRPCANHCNLLYLLELRPCLAFIGIARQTTAVQQGCAQLLNDMLSFVGPR